ncbi:MAG: SLBB domain-containing protein [Novosphingobium sp.]|nr:SLBB domain-containing protein [Novosphingobium sp.]
MTVRPKPLLSGCAVVALMLSGAMLSGPAFAQLAAPVAQPSASGDASARQAASGQVAVPSGTVASYQPDVIQNAVPAGDQSAARGGGDPAGPPPARRDKDEAPPPPSEFEDFASTVVGKPLRRFGADLLVPEARDFTAPPTTTVPADYRLNPGDQLLIGLTGSVQAADLRLTVDNEGRIFVPRVGAILVGGVRYGDLHATIERQVSRQYRSFTLDVTVARLHGVTVYVTGFARQPGAYTVGSLSTLVNAVLAAGGPAAGGSFRSIQLRRGGRLLSDFDLYDLLLKGDKSGDKVLQNGDVIYVAPAGEQVAVIGSVNHEAIFEVGPGETVQDAILYAGGVSTVADGTRLMVLDSLGTERQAWEQLSAADAATRKARRGDVIRVLSNAGIARPIQQQSVLVTISGEVARPGRYYFQPGTRLADVVAQAGGLTEQAFPYASVITRESVKRQQRQSFDNAIRDMEFLLTAQPITSANRAQLVQPQNLTLVRSIVDQLRQREPTGRLVFDLPVTAAALPADLIVENNDTIYVPPRPVTVGVFGAVPTQASFAYRGGATVRDYLTSAGGVQKLGDRGEIFVVRANGTVLSKGALRARALPGDLIFVPIDADRGEFWARLRDITGSLFGGVVAAASVSALVQ